MIARARSAAFTALEAIERGRVDLPTALAQSREQLGDDRDRALAADIVSGTLRWRATLDHLIGAASGRPLERLDAEIVTILRLSLYQILHLTRVPASAVVDDAVDLARQARKPSATTFVNAVLRTLVRQRNRLPLPARPSDGEQPAAFARWLAITGSHPHWLLERWIERHGLDATERWVHFNNSVPSLTLRSNRLRGTRDELADALRGAGVETTPTEWAPDGLRVTSGHPLRTDLGHRFVVQDEASQLVPLALGASRGERVLDLCASPGGKTTALAGIIGDTGLVVACDVRPRRVRLLRDGVARSGATCVRIVQVPRSDGLPFRAAFDRVLVDAPCSGLGTLRRDPDLKWRRRPVELPAFAEAQRALIHRAADLIVPGGRLVYATCSSEPEENEDVIAAFLSERPDFRPLDLRETLGPGLDPLVDGRGHLRTLPFLHGLEAFYAAALVRAKP